MRMVGLTPRSEPELTAYSSVQEPTPFAVSTIRMVLPLVVMLMVSVLEEKLTLWPSGASGKVSATHVQPVQSEPAEWLQLV